MRKIIYFNNDNQTRDYCTGQVYRNFLDYAFSETDYFMLVYVNYYGKGYSSTMKQIKQLLNPYKVKSRSNPSWPGTTATFTKQTKYKVIFYKNAPEAKEILNHVNCLSDWSCPSNPQDLAFFKGNQCWFYSVGHEKIGAIIHASEKDVDFLERHGLAMREQLFADQSKYYDAYDEQII